MKDVKNITILAAFFLIVWLLFRSGCNSNIITEPPIKSDTIIDTIWHKDTIIKMKPIYKPTHDTIVKLDTITISQLKDSIFYVRTYSDSISDTNQTIFITNKVTGYLNEARVSYRLKVPTLITKTITNTETKYKPNKWDVFVMGGVGGNATQFDVNTGLYLRVKKTYIGYDYSLIGKTHNLKAGYKLFGSKK